MKLNHRISRNSYVLIALAAAWAASSARAGTDTWLLAPGPTGSVAKWNNPSGWSAGFPQAVDDALFPTGTACDENNAGTTYINNLTVQSGATLEVFDDNSGGMGNSNVFFDVSGSLANDGTTWVAGGGGRGSDLIFTSSGTSISGNGTLTLQNAASVLISTASTPTLTIDANQTINGAGIIGADLINLGTIDASYGGEYASPMVLTTNAYNYDNGITTNTTAYTNQGTMEATGGDSLQIGDGNAMTLNNTGGTINATGTAGSYGSQINIENGVTITGGTLSSDGNQSTYSDYINTNGTVTLNGVTITSGSILRNPNTLSLQGNITNNGDIENSGGISVNGSQDFLLTNNGTIHSSGGSIVVATKTELAGTGNVLVDGAEFDTTGAATLTVDTSQTIHGWGYIAATMVNNGTINADQNSYGGPGLTLEQTDSNVPGSNSSGITNNGLIEATNSVGLNINGLAINNANGTIATNGGVVQFNGTTIHGGTLSAIPGSNPSGTNEDFRTGGTTTFNGVTIDTNAYVEAGGQINLIGTISNGGTINSHGNQYGFSGGPIVLSSNTELAGDGSIILNRVGLQAADPSYTLTIDAPDVAGSWAIQTNNNISVSVVNYGNIGIFNGTYSGDEYITSPSFINHGTLARWSGGYTLHLSSGIFTNAADGTVIAGNGTAITADGATVTNVSSGTLTGGTWIVDANASMNLGGGNITTNAATIILNGSNTSFSAISGLTSNTGTFKLENGAAFNFTGDFTNSGTLSLDPSSMHVAGNLVLNSSSILDIGLAGTGLGEYDTINVSGSAALGGQLVLNLESGFTAKVGDTFSFLTANGITGAFADSGPFNLNGYVLDLTPGTDSLGLQVTAVPTPEPATLALFALGLAGLGLSRRKNVKRSVAA